MKQEFIARENMLKEISLFPFRKIFEFRSSFIINEAKSGKY